MRRGYINLHRAVVDHPVVGVHNPNEHTLFVLLLVEAAYQKRDISVGGYVITLERGQLCLSQRFMCEKLKRSLGSIQRSLKSLVRAQTVTRTMHESRNHIITICNYDKYQTPGVCYDSGFESPPSHLRVKEKEYKELDNISIVREPCFVPSTGDFIVNHNYDVRIHNRHITRWRHSYPNANLVTLLPKLSVTFSSGPAITKYREFPHIWFEDIIASEHRKATKPSDKPKETTAEKMKRLGIK